MRSVVFSMEKLRSFQEKTIHAKTFEVLIPIETWDETVASW